MAIYVGEVKKYKDADILVVKTQGHIGLHLEMFNILEGQARAP